MSCFRLAAAGLVAVTIAVIHANAGTWNQKTTFTFNEPVAVPGQVLPAGTYTFKLFNTQADRDLVEVLGPNNNHFDGLFVTIPDYRHKPSGKPIVKFAEAPSGSPEAIRAWFYPHDSYGHEFVYPKKDARELAKASHKPVPSMPDGLAPDTTKPANTLNDPSASALNNAKITAEKPNGDEVPATEVFQRTSTAH